MGKFQVKELLDCAIWFSTKCQRENDAENHSFLKEKDSTTPLNL